MSTSTVIMLWVQQESPSESTAGPVHLRRKQVIAIASTGHQGFIHKHLPNEWEIEKRVSDLYTRAELCPAWHTASSSGPQSRPQGIHKSLHPAVEPVSLVRSSQSALGYANCWASIKSTILILTERGESCRVPSDHHSARSLTSSGGVWRRIWWFMGGRGARVGRGGGGR